MPIYQYQDQHYDLPDGLTNEQALEKIKAHLGETSAAPVAAVAQPSMVDELGRQIGLTARAGVKGLSTIPNAVADALAGVANLGLSAAGSEQRVPYLSQIQQEAINKTFPTPKEGLEQKVQTAAEAVAGLMAPGMKSPIAQQVEGQAPKEILRRGATEAAVATGSVVSEEAAKKAMDLTGSPWAALAAGLATGTIVGSGTGKGLYALSGPRKEPVSIEQIRARASQGFQAMDEANVALKTNGIKDGLLPKIEQELKVNNYDPAIVSAHKDIQDNLNLFQKITSDPYVDFNRLEKIRSSFSNMSKGTDDTSRLAKIVTNEIDSYLGNLKNTDTLSLSGADPKKALEAVNKARADWRNQSRAQVLQDILDSSVARVEGATGATGDIIKRNLVNLTANTEKMKMFSTREQNVIKAAAKATDLESILSILAKFNPERGALQAVIAGSSATQLDTLKGQIGTGLAAGGWAADKGLTAVRKKEVQDLISQIASGSLRPPKEGFAIPGLFGAAIGSSQQQ
jgi:hypothetical protein